MLFVIAVALVVSANMAFAKSGAPAQDAAIEVNATIDKYSKVIHGPGFSGSAFLEFSGAAMENQVVEASSVIEANGDTSITIFAEDLNSVSTPSIIPCTMLDVNGNIANPVTIFYTRMSDKQITLAIAATYTTGNKISDQAAIDDYAAAITVTIKDW